MTTETEYAQYTASDVERIVEEAVEQQRSMALAANCVLVLWSFLAGLICGWLAL